MPALIEEIAATLIDGTTVPPRHHHSFGTGWNSAGTLLLMPAWQDGRFIGVKVATVLLNNPQHGRPAIMGSYLLMDAGTGELLMIADGAMLTRRRTAAVSGLASRYLARSDSSCLLVIGAGALAEHMIEAHLAVRPIERVMVWARRSEAADALINRLHVMNTTAARVEDLEAAIHEADIVSAATSSEQPIVFGKYLHPGMHLDLVGSFTPAMHEVDSETLRRSEVYVDTAAALHESGDFITAISSEAWDPSTLRGDLGRLLQGGITGRATNDAITLFKSIGTAAADLAAARLLWRRLTDAHQKLDADFGN